MKSERKHHQFNWSYIMSEEKSCCCQKPEMLKGTPEKCSPETIKQCHGDQPSHPCLPEDPKAPGKKE
jgi:hypothetical protein